MEKIKHGITWAASILLVLFTLQNIGYVKVNFLIWSFIMPRFVVILLSVAVGILIGWVLVSRRKHHTKPQDNDG